MKNRIERIFEKEDEDIDAIVILNSTKPHVDLTFYYITGLIQGEFEGSGVIAYPDGKAEIMTSRLEEESAKKADMPVHTISKTDEREEWLNEKLDDLNKIGVNSSELTYSAYKKIRGSTDAEIVDVSDSIAETRNIKDEEEIERLSEACRIASKVAEEMTDFIKPGLKEYQVAAEISYRMKKLGATADAFDTISSSGPNSAEPHYTSGNRVIQEGDFIVLDFGALYKRYRSDITRTYIIGEASDKQRRMYETVLKAQEAALDMIKPGVEGSKIHEVAQEVIDSTEFEGYFTHGLGHSIGLAIHDGSGLSPNVDVVLQPGMVYTVEPGIYIPEFGGVRIEDDIVVTEKGCDILTDANKDLTVLG